MAMLLFVLYLIFSFFIISKAMNSLIWELGSIAYLFIASFIVGMPWLAGITLWTAIVGIILVLRVEALRVSITDMLYKKACNSIPKLSKTEEEALNAGDTWLEETVFRGEPDWQKVASVRTELTAEEQDFLDNEVQTLCSMLDEWTISQQRDLPEAVWTYIKEKGFFGLVISKEFGGKGFSARAHSDVVLKIASRSSVGAVTVMVPNSLGPGELLQHYGTDAQKQHYLPRLASGQDIPCFALTEPDAGSDATSIKSEALVVEKEVDGRKILGLTLNLNKRWITLSPIATLIGLAVNLKDPDGLLGKEGQEGISCLLIPRTTANLEIGNRHLPADQPFMNGTIRGKDIFVPIDCIIGGQKMAGQGWKMLVECLSIGRSISLPALGTSSSAVAYIAAGAFARVRRQFNVEIAQFEGIEEKLAEIAGLSYLTAATRTMTLAAVNEGKKPSVASGITKYFNTELSRICINSAMDILAGRAVVVGPRNFLMNMYQSIPIAVTVEGANIMSRNLLIFGQGSMACHPFIREEFYALSQQDKAAFSDLIWKHLRYFLQNMSKAILSAWSGSWFAKAPQFGLKREYQKMLRLSHAFAWMADLSLMILGGDLKRKERLSARLADAMSHLYMALAVFNTYEQHQNEDEALHAKWALSYCFYHTQKALIDFCDNFPIKAVGYLIRALVFPWGRTMRLPSDQQSHSLAKLMVQNNHYRQRIAKLIYLSGDPKQPLDKVEVALQAMIQHADLYAKIAELKRYRFEQLAAKLAIWVSENKLSQSEMDQIVAVEKLRWDAIQVDEFDFETMKKQHYGSLTDTISSPL